MNRFAVTLILTVFPFVARGITTTQVVDTASGFSAIVITVSSNENLGFCALDVPSKKDGDSIKAYWNPTNYTFIINGGYFNPDFSPSGLCRIDSRDISSSTNAKLSGFVAIDRNGAIHILTKQDNMDSFPSVIQSGPFVIDPGGKVGIKSQTGTEARRTLVGSRTSGDIVIIITEPITLPALCDYVHRNMPDVERLLNLDGGPSTGFISERQSINNQWPVRNYIAKRKAQRQTK